MGELQQCCGRLALHDVRLPLLKLSQRRCIRIHLTNTRTQPNRQRTLPPKYADSTYELLDVGTWVNDTHWQFTAKCTGCTTWKTPDGEAERLDPAGKNKIAWAYANLPPVNPASADSAFSFHDVYGYFDHDLALGANENFKSLVSTADNPPTPSPVPTACVFTWTPPPGAIIVTEFSTTTITVANLTVTATPICT